MNTVESLQNSAKAHKVNVGDKGAILLMLYNAGIELLEEAKSALKEGDLVAKGTYLSQAHAIISELLVSLDFNIDGELARNLEDLYLFMLDQLMAANINNDPKPLEVVGALLRTLQQAWEGAVAAERAGISQESQRRSKAA
jgi:flagellar secretion chaperone FliS